MTDQYQYWREALAGNNPAIDVNSPQPGFYQMRNVKDGPLLPVFIGTNEQGDLVARVGDFGRDPHDIWQWCAGRPVKQDDAKHAFKHGSWPGDVPELPDIGHNAPPASIEEQIDDVTEQALSWLKEHGIKDETSSNIAANYRQQLLDLSKKADAKRVEEKRPHDEAAKEVQARWKPVIDKAKGAADNLRNALTRWMRAEEDRLRKEAAEKARIERERQEREAAEAAAQGVEPEEPQLPIEPAPAPKVQAGGQRGRKTALRTVKRAVIKDWDMVVEHFKRHEKVEAVLNQLCQHAARDGHPVPGVEVVEEKVAA